MQPYLFVVVIIAHNLKRQIMKPYIFITLCILGQTIFAQSLPDNIDISTSPNGIVDMPSNVPSAFINDGFIKYTKIQCPNGEAIHIVAQSELSDAQIIRSRSILEFYLSDFEGSIYGADKEAVMNTMGVNDALLLLMNGEDGEYPEPSVWGQPLYNDELPVEGDQWFMTNDFEHRDAAFEEILHLMHDMGIGVDGTNSISNPALPEYQTEIRAAQINAGLNNFAIWPIGADGSGSEPWIQDAYDELAQENSLSQEYLASVIDSYYGLWGAWTEEPTLGMWGMYAAHDRAEIELEDPMGFAVVENYFAPYINIDMVIDASLNEVFSMTFNPLQPYTHKSQYLQHCYLTGNNNSGLTGNDLYNRLNGNAGNNTLEGKTGNDRLDGLNGENTAVFTGAYAAYTITNNTDYALIEDVILDRDGVDTLWNIHKLQFVDQNVDIVLSSTVGLDDAIDSYATLSFYPNPARDILNIESSHSSKLSILSISGQVLLNSKLTMGFSSLDISYLSEGIYFLVTENNSPQKLIIKN